MRNWKQTIPAILLGIFFSTGALAACPRFAGGGGEVPSPFEIANQKVELADGETYVLVGRILIEPALGRPGSNFIKAVFQVDLEEHPWLATMRRKANPNYPLDGSLAYWKQFAGSRVKLTCQARGVVLDGASGSLGYSLMLKPISETPVESFQDADQVFSPR